MTHKIVISSFILKDSEKYSLNLGEAKYSNKELVTTVTSAINFTILNHGPIFCFISCNGFLIHVYETHNFSLILTIVCNMTRKGTIGQAAA